MAYEAVKYQTKPKNPHHGIQPLIPLMGTRVLPRDDAGRAAGSVPHNRHAHR